MRNDPCLAHHDLGLGILHLVVHVLEVLVKVRPRLLKEACREDRVSLGVADLLLLSLSNLLEVGFLDANETLDPNPCQGEP